MVHPVAQEIQLFAGLFTRPCLRTQEIEIRRANAAMVSKAKTTRDTPRDIINEVLSTESDLVAAAMVSEPSLRRK